MALNDYTNSVFSNDVRVDIHVTQTHPGGKVNKVKAIKAIRSSLNVDLKTAKELVECAIDRAKATESRGLFPHFCTSMVTTPAQAGTLAAKLATLEDDAQAAALGERQRENWDENYKEPDGDRLTGYAYLATRIREDGLTEAEFNFARIK